MKYEQIVFTVFSLVVVALCALLMMPEVSLKVFIGVVGLIWANNLTYYYTVRNRLNKEANKTTANKA